MNDHVNPHTQEEPISSSPSQGQDHHDLVMDADAQKQLAARRKKRSLVLGLALAALVVLFYAVTIVKIGPAIFDRAL